MATGGRFELPLAIVAGAGTGLGVAAAINPAFVAGMPLVGAVQSSLAGVEPILAVAVGVLAIAGAVGATSDRAVTAEARTDTGPATQFDRTVRAVDARRRERASDEQPPIEILIQAAIAGDDRALAAVRSRLRELAKANLTETDLSPGGVLATSEWTDDEIAGRFLQPRESTTWPLSDRVRSWLDRKGERRRRIRRTIAAIDALSGSNGVDDTEPTTPESGGGEAAQDPTAGGTA